MSKVILFGEGKIAEEVYYYLTNDSPHEVVAFTVDKAHLTSKTKLNLPVVPFEEVQTHYSYHEFKMFIATGYQNLNNLRATKYYEAKKMGYQFISYISSMAGNFGKINIGENSLVLDNSTLQPCCSIGNNVIIWSNNLIGHHSKIEDHCYIAGNVTIAGSSSIGPYCFLGINSCIGHELTIGEKSLIGAGAIITKSCSPKSVFIQPETPKFRLDSTAFIKLTNL